VEVEAFLALTPDISLEFIRNALFVEMGNFIGTELIGVEKSLKKITLQRLLFARSSLLEKP
jgi:hypothetical protein